MCVLSIIKKFIMESNQTNTSLTKTIEQIYNEAKKQNIIKNTYLNDTVFINNFMLKEEISEFKHDTFKQNILYQPVKLSKTQIKNKELDFKKTI